MHKERYGIAAFLLCSVMQTGAPRAAGQQRNLLPAVPPKAMRAEAIANSVFCRYPKHKREAGDLNRFDPRATVPEVEPNNRIPFAQVINVGLGAGQSPSEDVTGSISNGGDVDFFQVSLEKGDILGAACLGDRDMDPVIRLFGSDESFIFLNDDDFGATSLFPPGSPFPGGVRDFDSALTFVIPASGDYFIEVFPFDAESIGPYTLQLMVTRPSSEIEDEAGAEQAIFLDFDGAGIDAASLFGDGSRSANLSPLSAFLANWGLSSSDEDAVIDAIVAGFRENLDGLRSSGLNGDRDTDLTDGHFDIEVLNSRDHPTAFGRPNVARIIIGGTIPQLGLATIGIAQYIDPGNFAREDTAVVLLDLLSLTDSGDPLFVNSLNSVLRAAGVGIIDLIGVAVGNIAAHEAGHYLGCWHTSNGLSFDETAEQFFCGRNVIRNIMDAGGCDLPVGLGPDGRFGNGDDIDLDFVEDEYCRFEGVGFGTERTNFRTAFALSTGTLPSIAPSLSGIVPPQGAMLAGFQEVSLSFTEYVEGVGASSVEVNGARAGRVSGVGAGPYLFQDFGAAGTGELEVRFMAAGITDLVGNIASDFSWTYTVADCDDNGISDLDEITSGAATDCNGNSVPDECEVALPPPDGLPDCNGNGLPDGCDLLDNDCNLNGVPDDCDLRSASPSGSTDCNGNGVLDECETGAEDCNGNGVPDDCDLRLAPPSGSTDCNGNGVLDECETGAEDCNGNGVPDPCDADVLTALPGADRSISIGEATALGGEDTAIGGIPPYRFLWTLRGNSGPESSTEASPMFDPPAPGMYTVKLAVKDSVDCVSVAFVNVRVIDNGGGGSFISTSTGGVFCADGLCGTTGGMAMTGLLVGCLRLRIARSRRRRRGRD